MKYIHEISVFITTTVKMDEDPPRFLDAVAGAIEQLPNVEHAECDFWSQQEYTPEEEDMPNAD